MSANLGSGSESGSLRRATSAADALAWLLGGGHDFPAQRYAKRRRHSGSWLFNLAIGPPSKHAWHPGEDPCSLYTFTVILTGGGSGGI